MKILHLEDNLRDAELASELLVADWPDCTITRADNRPDCLAALQRGGFDLILSDYSMKSFDGFEALQLARVHLPETPFIFFSGTIGEERALEAVRNGAVDYVLKDNLPRLTTSIRRALQEAEELRRRKLAERHLREQADIIDRAAESIIVTDLTGRITRWNRGAERIFGLTAAETVGRTSDELFPAEVLQKLRAQREPTLSTTGEWHGEITVVLRSGREIVIDLHTTLIRDDAGQPKARLSIASDITEKKKLEEQFLRAQRLESLGMLAAGIAHDLNNVLAPVLMAAPLLRMRATDPSDVRTIDILEKSAERGSGLVRQILGFAQGTGGGLQLLQVKHLLRDIGDVITASFPKSIVLEDHVPTDLWPVQANATQIHQVLLNLCVNARDAMLPRGGTLRLRAENRTLDAAAARALEAKQPGAGARAGTFLLIEVADTGSGIPPEVLTQIWEPFFTTKPEGQGTGLGLSTVRGVINNHHGFVTIDTAVGRGTTFQVYLPAAGHGDDTTAVHATQISRRGRGELILVVDDESTVRDMSAAILTHQGYRVILAGDGVEAIGLFTQHRDEVRLVITDLNMPNLDGPSLALVLRRLQPEIKILVITGLASTGPGALKPADFANEKLQKPFTIEALLRAVERMIHPATIAG